VQVTFKEIVSHYRGQPQARPPIFRRVPLLQDNGLRPLKTGDIIAFYNTIIIPAAKDFLHAIVAGEVPLAQPPGEASPCPAGTKSVDTQNSCSESVRTDRLAVRSVGVYSYIPCYIP